MQLYNTTNLLSIIEGSIKNININDINKEAILKIASSNFRKSIGGSEFLNEELYLEKVMDSSNEKYRFKTFYSQLTNTIEIINDDELIISMYLDGEYYIIRSKDNKITTEETKGLSYMLSITRLDKDEIDTINISRHNGEHSITKGYKVTPIRVRQGNKEYFMMQDKEAGYSFKERLHSSELISVDTYETGVYLLPELIEEVTKTIDNKLNKNNKSKGLHRK